MVRRMTAQKCPTFPIPLRLLSCVAELAAARAHVDAKLAWNEMDGEIKEALGLKKTSPRPAYLSRKIEPTRDLSNFQSPRKVPGNGV